MIRRYSDLRRLETFKERFEYLNLKGKVGEDTFGFDRYLNQMLYTSNRWRRVRDKVILRDLGCDLGIEDNEINGNITVHHMNPITVEDIQTESKLVYDPEYLICVSKTTHNAIHYGGYDSLPKETPTRRPNDTCPWK